MGEKVYEYGLGHCLPWHPVHVQDTTVNENIEMCSAKNSETKVVGLFWACEK